MSDQLDVAAEPIIADQVELLGIVLNDTKLDFVMAVGYNKEKRRVLFVGTRLSGAETYQPVIEQDIDISSYWSDVKTDFGGKVDVPPPPPGKG